MLVFGVRCSGNGTDLKSKWKSKHIDGRAHFLSLKLSWKLITHALVSEHICTGFEIPMADSVEAIALVKLCEVRPAFYDQSTLKESLQARPHRR